MLLNAFIWVSKRPYQNITILMFLLFVQSVHIYTYTWFSTYYFNFDNLQFILIQLQLSHLLGIFNWLYLIDANSTIELHNNIRAIKRDICCYFCVWNLITIKRSLIKLSHQNNNNKNLWPIWKYHVCSCIKNSII